MVGIGVDLSTEEQYLTLCHNVYNWCKAYLDKAPVVEDAKYDFYKEHLAIAEQMNPHWIVSWSPVNKPMCGIPDGNAPSPTDKILEVMSMG